MKVAVVIILTVLVIPVGLEMDGVILLTTMQIVVMMVATVAQVIV